MNGWAYLYLGVLFGGLSLPLAKWSNGFEQMAYGVGAVLLYGLATVSWILAVKTIPLTTAYMLWIGLDAAIVFGIGYLLFAEHFTLMKLVYIALILIGCIGLNVLEFKDQQKAGSCQHDTI